jgi:hypothetical protein
MSGPRPAADRASPERAAGERPGTVIAAGLIGVVWGVLGVLFGVLALAVVFALGAVLGILAQVSVVLSAALLGAGLQVARGRSPRSLLLGYVAVGVNLLTTVVGLLRDARSRRHYAAPGHQLLSPDTKRPPCHGGREAVRVQLRAAVPV